MRDIAPLLRSFAQENATRFLSLLSLRRTLRRFALQKRGFGSRFATKEKSPRPTDLGLFSWLGFRHRNITFDESLDFDQSEIDFIYQNPQEEDEL